LEKSPDTKEESHRTHHQLTPATKMSKCRDNLIRKRRASRRLVEWRKRQPIMGLYDASLRFRKEDLPQGPPKKYYVEWIDRIEKP
jgi:hypothetical protein